MTSMKEKYDKINLKNKVIDMLEDRINENLYDLYETRVSIKAKKSILEYVDALQAALEDVKAGKDPEETWRNL